MCDIDKNIGLYLNIFYYFIDNNNRQYFAECVIVLIS